MSEDPIANDTIISSDLPIKNASTHRLVGLVYPSMKNSAWSSSSYFQYDNDGRCITYGYQSSESVLEYWDDWEYNLTWEGEKIVSEHYESSSDLDWYQYTRNYTYTSIGNQIKRYQYDADDQKLLNITWWIEGEQTIFRSVDYHYDWQIGLYDSTVVFYQDIGFNKYERYQVKQNDTTLVRTERYDSKGRLISYSVNGTSRMKHYYNSLKNPYPMVSMLPDVFCGFNTGIEEYGVFLYSESESLPVILANGDLPQKLINQDGTTFFRYEDL